MDSPTDAYGRLGLLALETREEIYRHIFFPGYMVPRPGVLLHCPDSFAGRRIRSRSLYGDFVCANIGIFETSRLLRTESLAVFYRQCTFRMTLGRIAEDELDTVRLGLAYEQSLIPLSKVDLRLLQHLAFRPLFGIDVQSIKRMRNLELDVVSTDRRFQRLEGDERDGRIPCIDAILRYITATLKGSRPTRKSCRVNFHVCQLVQFAWQKTPLPFPIEPAHFTCFQSFTMVFTTIGPGDMKWLRAMNLNARVKHDLFADKISEVKQRLEACLGPATMVESINGDTWDMILELHPNAHAKRLQSNHDTGAVVFPK